MRKKRMLIINVALIAIMLFSLDGLVNISKSSYVEQSVPVEINGTTIYVGGSGYGNYSNIQDAIDNASDGDTVFVYIGNYSLSSDVTISKMIHLTGEDRNLTIVGDMDKKRQVYIGSDKVIIDNFSFQNICIENYNNNVSLIYNNFLITIYNYNGNNAVILSGSLSSGGYYNVFKGNNITLKDRPEELFSPYYGMCLYEYRSNVVNNTISGAYEGLDIWGETDKDRKSGMNIISGNTFTKNDYGLYVSFSITDPYTNQITRNNFIGNYNHASFDYYVGTSARVFIRMLLTNNAPSQSWNGNYWDDHQSNNPRVINGTYNIDLSRMLGINPVIGLYIQIPKEEFDLNPSCAPL